MKVLWRSDLGQGKHDPLEVVSLVTKSGSSISADLVVPMDMVKAEFDIAARSNYGAAADAENAGLLEVIDAQMTAIDELTKKALGGSEDVDDEVDERVQEVLGEVRQDWADAVEDLCMALGFARNPIAPTGIPELDIIVKLCR